MRKRQIFLWKKAHAKLFLFGSYLHLIFCLISLYIIIYNNYITVNFVNHFGQVNFLLMKSEIWERSHPYPWKWRNLNITTLIKILKPYLKSFLSNFSKCLLKNVKGYPFCPFLSNLWGSKGRVKTLKPCKIFFVRK